MRVMMKLLRFFLFLLNYCTEIFLLIISSTTSLFFYYYYDNFVNVKVLHL